MSIYNQSNNLTHHGIKGQKWGVRRFQNEDGTLTSQGKKRYASEAFEKTKNAYEGIKKTRENLKKKTTDRIKDGIKERMSSKKTKGQTSAEKALKKVADILVNDLSPKKSPQPWDEKPSGRSPFDEKPSKNAPKI